MARMWSLLIVALFFLAVPAPAGALVVLEESFDSNLPNFAANSDWERSYCSDNWRTDMNGGVVANRDDGCQGCYCNFYVQSVGGNSCINSDAFDNHIQTGNKYWQNYIYSVKFRNADDDSMGVVFRYVDASTFYLFVMSRDLMPAPASGCDDEFEGARLLRVLSGNVKVIKGTQGFTYTPNTVHQIRVTAVLNHIKVEVDLDGDGQFGVDEVFYDGEDDKGSAIPSGMVGLYSYDNGVQGTDETPACANKGCWFDDVSVDVLPPNDDGCGDVAWEGTCNSDTLSFCDKGGQLQVGDCPPNYCCRWVPDESFYTCVKAANCGAACQDHCQEGQKGCSANLSHRLVCGQGDGDACLEPLFEACPVNTVCNPSSGLCELACETNCAGKMCGDDGCGGPCGFCDDGLACVEGQCKSSGDGQLGAPCQGNPDCALSMCVEMGDGMVCTKACAGDSACPSGFDCQEKQANGVPLLVCVPTGACQPDCQSKQCGTDGCDGSCGTCGAGYECVAGQCKALAGATCQQHEDCASGLCIYFQSGVFCSSPCSTDSGCPSGWNCGPWLAALTPNICSPPTAMVAHEECRQIAECIDGCPSSNAACFSNCFFLGSEEAKQEYADLFICADVSCFDLCDGIEGCLSECLLDSCFQQFAVCYPGSKSCKHALDCLLDCSGNQDCMSSCYDEALPAAKVQILELLDCLGELCEEGAGPDCFAAAISGPCKEAYDNCSAQCEPICDGKECGDDGCGGGCGDCAQGHECKGGQCTPICVPQCDGKQCGEDGCDGLCGVCPEGLVCEAGICQDEPQCEPHAYSKCIDEQQLFWFDSCDKQEELAQLCGEQCVDDHCTQPTVEALDTVGEPADATYPWAKAEPTVMSAAGKQDSGCNASALPVPGGAALLLLLTFGLALMRRRTPGGEENE